MRYPTIIRCCRGVAAGTRAIQRFARTIRSSRLKSSASICGRIAFIEAARHREERPPKVAASEWP